MTEELWNYAVYHADTAPALKASIESDTRLGRDEVPSLSSGLLCAVAFPEREADEARAALLREIDGQTTDVQQVYVVCGPREVNSDARLIWMFPGQGAQRVGLLKGLYERSPFFRSHLDLYLGQASSEVGSDFLDALYPAGGATPENEAKLTQTSFCQPVMVGVTLALAAWFREAGIKLDGAMGHSLGEFTAAACLGGLEPSALMRFVARRGQVMVSSLEGQDPGAMAAVMAPADAVAQALEAFPDVIVANINQPKQTVISGPTTAVETAVKALRRARLPGKKIQVSHAFHSPMMQAAAKALLPEVNKVAFSDLKQPLHSSILVSSIREAEKLREMFHCHAESPVDFIGALRDAVALGDTTSFIEMGPGKTLSSFARYTLGEEDVAIESTSVSEDGEAQLAKAFVALVRRGIPVGSGMLAY